MSFDNGATATYLKTTMEGLSGIGNVQIGAPASLSTQVNGYVTLGSQQSARKTTGTTRRETRFFCMFAYRVDGAETTAEITLMTLVDAFLIAISADLTLGGTAVDAKTDTAAADEPEYQLRGGKEYREYPVIVTATQQGSYEVNP